MVTPVGSVPKASLTLSPSSVRRCRRAAVKVKLFVRLRGPEDHRSQAPRSSSEPLAPPWSVAVIGIVTSRSGAASSVTVTSTVPPSATAVRGGAEARRHRANLVVGDRQCRILRCSQPPPRSTQLRSPSLLDRRCRRQSLTALIVPPPYSIAAPFTIVRVLFELSVTGAS